MYQAILKNLDKIFISFSGLILFELIQKYYNLKNFKVYKNYCIKTKDIYHIDMYKKDNLKNFNNFYKFNNFNKINFIFIPYLKHINSISINKKDDTFEIFNNVKYINPQYFLYYNNDYIFENIVKVLSEKVNTHEFINFANFVNSYKLNKNIKYKISQNKNGICLYKNNKLILIADVNDNILIKSIEDEINYFTCSLIFAFFWIIYK